MKLDASIGELDVNVPLVFGDAVAVDLSSDYTMDKSYHLKGFYFKGDTEGAWTVVTLASYMRNGGNAFRNTRPSDVEVAAVITTAVAAGDTVDLLLAAYQISELPIAFIESTDAPSTTVNAYYY